MPSSAKPLVPHRPVTDARPSDRAKHRRLRASRRLARAVFEPLEQRLCLSTPNFQAPTTLATAEGPSSTAIADFNADGHLDLVSANISSNNISVLLGNGDGTALPAVNYAMG